MSGGSYNYLCFAVDEPGKLDDRRDELEEMRKRLCHLGYYDLAERTQEVTRLLDEVVEKATALAEVWKAVEWRDSMDWSDKTMHEVLLKHSKG